MTREDLYKKAHEIEMQTVKCNVMPNNFAGNTWYARNGVDEDEFDEALDAFNETLEEAYRQGIITDEEYDDIAEIAFFDFEGKVDFSKLDDDEIPPIKEIHRWCEYIYQRQFNHIDVLDKCTLCMLATMESVDKTKFTIVKRAYELAAQSKFKDRWILDGTIPAIPTEADFAEYRDMLDEAYKNNIITGTDYNALASAVLEDFEPKKGNGTNGGCVWGTLLSDLVERR